MIQELALLSCKEVLARHSEYVDGVMPGAESDRIRMHLVACASCARYDSVVRQGTQIFISQPVVQPDASFMDQLHSRIADEEYRMSMRPVSTNAATYVSVAAMIALAAWIPGLLSNAKRDDRAFQNLSSEMASDMASTEIAWHGGDAVDDGARHMRLDAPAVQLRSNNSAISLIGQRYSPLILDAPTAPPTYTRVSFTAYNAR